MTLPSSGCRLSTPRLPLSQDPAVGPSPIDRPGHSRGTSWRVPATGIPKPDQDDASPGAARATDLRCFWRVAGTSLLGVMMMAASAAATPSSDGGVIWQFNPNVGIKAILAGKSNAGHVPGQTSSPARTSRAVIKQRPPQQGPGADWTAADNGAADNGADANRVPDADGGAQDGGEQQAAPAEAEAAPEPAEIVPSEAEYLVRAQINPQDIADVQPGQVARISLAAYDPSRYGVVMGVVRRVASNTTQPENAMPFYETIIAIPEVAFTKSPDEPVISSGMPLQVDILGGKRTVMEYIMTPIQKSLATAFREK